MSDNHLYYGDNLDVLPTLASESVDLIYLDPPFNSARNYNVIFARSTKGETANAGAQVHAFSDTWTWTPEVAAQYDKCVGGGLSNRAAEALVAFRKLLGENDALAYLVMMAPRLAEMRRVLKSTGSIYLHCDQTMAHYIKVLMDSIFGVANFLNNVVWLYGLGGSSKRYWPRKHDDILWYSKEPDQQYFDADRIPALSNRMKGQDKKAPDYWDIPALNNMAKERLGYPTQKPLALLERIIRSSTKEGDVVLDPFCGCGTTVDAAQKLGRKWIGIDVAYIAVDLIQKRLENAYGRDVFKNIEISGIPRDVESADALFARNPFEFERWAVSQVSAEPNQKGQVADKGIDGVARFPLGFGDYGRILVSVKGGKTVTPSMVRDLAGTVNRERAELGLLVMRSEPSKGVIDEVNHGGSYVHPPTGQTYPKLQVVTTTQLIEGHKPNMPATKLPYIPAETAAAVDTSATLDLED